MRFDPYHAMTAICLSILWGTIAYNWSNMDTVALIVSVIASGVIVLMGFLTSWQEAEIDEQFTPEQRVRYCID